MTAPISVVIPTYQAAGQIGPTLQALMEGVSDGLIAEVIFADGGSDDQIAEVADGVGAHVVTAPRGRGTQLAKGCETARAQWLLVIHADTVMSPGWSAVVRNHMDTAPDRAGYARLAFDANGLAPRIVAGWANVRSRYLGLPYGDQGLLLPRGVYQKIGGYPEIPLMEDVVMARRLGRRLKQLDMTATTSAEKYQRHGWIRQGARNLTALLRFALGQSADSLAQRRERP